jgi:hypothetical protein
MNQGMVAFVDGKFTNASAHTSYLILLKNPRLHEPALFRFAENRNLVPALVATLR